MKILRKQLQILTFWINFKCNKLIRSNIGPTTWKNLEIIIFLTTFLVTKGVALTYLNPCFFLIYYKSCRKSPPHLYFQLYITHCLHVKK